MYLIGDPHIGRTFVANVPLDRRGEREQMMMKDFERRLNASDETTIVVGDLIDRPLIAVQTLYELIGVIISAAYSRPNRKIIIIAGNHDLNKATEVRGSFHLLAVALERVPNVEVLLKPKVIDGIAFFPWQYERTAKEQVDDLRDSMGIMHPTTAIGHWDLECFGEHDTHLCPARELIAAGIVDIYTGHWHIAGDYNVAGIDVHCTGSMQPLTHSEDTTGDMYVTLSKEQYEQKDHAYCRNRYLRIRAKRGDEVAAPETCLGFKVEYSDADDSGTTEQVNLGDFNMDKIMAEAMTKFELPETVRTFIKENVVC